MTNEIAERTDEEIEAALCELEAERARRRTQLRQDARTVHRAMAGWERVRGEDDWVRLYEEAAESHRTGRFLLERLGAERHLDPELMAVLARLRTGLVGTDGGSAAEAMAADLAVVAFYNALRVQQWVGDLAVLVERELFGPDAPSARFDDRYGRATGLVIEEHLRRLGEQMLPLQDRAGRAALRNLKALAELRRGPTPAVAIGSAQQVNVGSQQVNVAGAPDPTKRSGP
jgi:hypothetical protein